MKPEVVQVGKRWYIGRRRSPAAVLDEWLVSGTYSLGETWDAALEPEKTGRHQWFTSQAAAERHIERWLT